MKLRDCPFCADNEELRVCQPPHMRGYWVVHCGSCGGEMQAETEGGAIAGWNERAQLDLYEAALREACEAIDVADNIIAINCGLDTPKEWDRAFKAVVKARARLSTDTGA